MGLENATTIPELDPLWPLGTDPKSQGDDHLRMIKAVLQNDAVSQSEAEPQAIASDLGLGLGTHLQFTGEGVDALDPGHIRTTDNNFLDLDLIDPGGLSTYSFRLGRNTNTEGQSLQTVFYQGDNTNTFGAAISHAADGGTQDDAAIVVPLGVIETQQGSGGFRAVRGDSDGSSAQLLANQIIRDGNGVSSLYDFALENGGNAGANDFEVRIARTADAPDAALSIYNPNTTTRRVQLRSGPTTGHILLERFQIGALSDGTPSAGYLSVTPGNPFTIQSGNTGTATLATIRSAMPENVVSFSFKGGGGLTATDAVPTRASGDARWVNTAALRAAVVAAADFADLKARMIAAFDEPVDMSEV